MAANTSPIFGLSANVGPDGGTNGGVEFVNADGTTAQTVFTSGTDGAVLRHLNACSDDTSAIDCSIYLNDGTADYLLGTVTVPTLAGTDGTEPAVDLLDPGLIPGVGIGGELFIPATWTVKVGLGAAVTAAKTLTLVGIGVDY